MSSLSLSHDTVSDLTRRNADLWPDQVAFIFDGVEHSWREVEQVTDRIASWMLDEGIEKGMHLGFWSLTSLDLVYHLIAAMKIGAIPAIINYSYRTFELEGVILRAQIERLFLGERKRGSDYAAMAGEVAEDQGLQLEVFEMAASMHEAMDAWETGEAFVETKRRDLQRVKDAVFADDVADIAFTSGTTKQPKPVMLTFFNIVNNALQIGELMHVTHEDILIGPMPMFHSSGVTGTLFYALTSGMTTLLHRMFKTEEVLADIQRYRPTVLMMVPSMAELMVACKDFHDYDISSLRVGLISGSVTSPEKMRLLLRELGIEHLLNAYGQTECAPIITSTLYDDDMIRATETVGRPLPHTRLRIWNEATNTECPIGVVGKIQVRGFHTMKGYFNYEEENAKKYTSDGWLKTTDAGWLDECGYLHFSTRISSMIIRHGENISPAEIEAVVDRFADDIVAVKVVGVPDEETGEAIACLVQTRASTIDPKGLKRFVKGKLASYKVPKWVFQIDEFPMTATTKISEKECRKLAREFAEEGKEGRV